MTINEMVLKAMEQPYGWVIMPELNSRQIAWINKGYLNQKPIVIELN